MTTYVSYFDKSYFPRGAAMIDSLLAVAPGARIVVWALDAETKRGLRNLYQDRVIALDHDYVDVRWPEMTRPPTQRNYWESIAMRKSCLLWSVMQEMMAPEELLFYADSDCLFYSSPDPALAMMKDASIGVSRHAFSPRHRWLLKNGVYNAGLMIIRNDEQGLLCMRDWADDCYDWCHHRVEGYKLMNQGYLTRWPHRYQRVTDLDHFGLNLAPWNFEGRDLSTTDGVIRVNGQPLIVYHFHGMKRNNGEWMNVSPLIDKDLHPDLFEQVYVPYIAQLKRGEDRLGKLGFDLNQPTFEKYSKKG